MNPWPITPPGPNDLNFAVVSYGFTDSLANDLAELPSDLDAIDLTMLDLASSVVDQTVLIASMFDGLDDLGSIIGEIDASPLDSVLGELANTAAAGDATLSDYQGMLTGTNDGGGSGGGGSTPPTQSANCGTHGASNIQLSDDTGNCFASNVLPVVAIADGACFFPYLCDGSEFMGRVTVTGITLTTGDAQFWSASLDAVTPQGSNTPVSRVTFKLTPYKTGHFLAKFTVHTSTRNPTEIWCLIVDVIEGTPASGGGGGGGGGGSTPKGGTQ